MSTTEHLATLSAVQPSLSAPTLSPAEAALAQHGFSWERLEKLARKALHDQMLEPTRRGRSPIVLDEARYEKALFFFVERGLRWAGRYDPAKARGVSFPTSCYRTGMQRALTDFLREEHGDARRGTPLHEVASGLLEERPALFADGFDEAVAQLAANLPARARWTLEHLARPIAEGTNDLAGAARSANVTLDYAEELLEELGWRLGYAPPQTTTTETDDFVLMEAWSA